MIKQTFAALLLANTLPAKIAIAQTTTDAQPTLAETFAAQDAAFAKWMADSHVPGLVWGVVIDGQLVHVKAMGVQDLGDAKRAVTADTGFRIASMSKAFTGYAILKLRDEGKLRLDDPAWKHVPELKSWARDITVADLLYHNSGFVTDDPWGDRQQPMSETMCRKTPLAVCGLNIPTSAMHYWAGSSATGRSAIFPTMLAIRYFSLWG
jgi:serine-type D-Ala-D-Ala carboxypeptidase/endopeptidase